MYSTSECASPSYILLFGIRVYHYFFFSANTQHSSLKKLPLGQQSVKEILQNNMVYIDKTGLILDLITNTDERVNYLEIVRPRGFG